MEGRVTWIHQQQSQIGFDELSSMVSELMRLFEREADDLRGDSHSSDWVSDSGLTRVVRHGSSASLHSMLRQQPDAVSFEYEILHCGVRVFQWCEYRWPHLQRRQLSQRQESRIVLPSTCLQELLQFHEQRRTPWLLRYRQWSMTADSVAVGATVQVDEVGVMAEPDRLHLLQS